jgi:hypothetical protein
MWNATSSALAKVQLCGGSRQNPALRPPESRSASGLAICYVD